MLSGKNKTKTKSAFRMSKRENGGGACPIWSRAARDWGPWCSPCPVLRWWWRPWWDMTVGSSGFNSAASWIANQSSLHGALKIKTSGTGRVRKATLSRLFTQIEQMHTNVSLTEGKYCRSSAPKYVSWEPTRTVWLTWFCFVFVFFCCCFDSCHCLAGGGEPPPTSRCRFDTQLQGRKKKNDI